ncbi:hypothetical protein P280DRAFT_300301 [Massarina eburnea CBS 473.64]|uniref:Uncharacterized protein n=1 Tax=Massarina eburnea CBS 473.64 TaxID=1395130 RepID=A0A6A6S2Z2_9PLEO|nr:hypothetical protein P280DRAFT_300301 [Massarina eburnea CBS 473.64]
MFVLICFYFLGVSVFVCLFCFVLFCFITVVVVVVVIIIVAGGYAASLGMVVCRCTMVSYCIAARTAPRYATREPNLLNYHVYY